MHMMHSLSGLCAYCIQKTHEGIKDRIKVIVRVRAIGRARVRVKVRVMVRSQPH